LGSAAAPAASPAARQEQEAVLARRRPVAVAQVFVAQVFVAQVFVAQVFVA
jgi:hypothetical protein